MYQITIYETRIKKVPGGREWKEGAGDEGSHNWGYTPRITIEQEVEDCIYKQSFKKLELGDVIKAINGLTV